jgi:N-acetylmuramoyl-L-alanine amidase
MNARWLGSPNFSTGRAGFRPEAIVIHIMQGTLEDTDSWFGATRSAVSAHYGIGRDGEIHQYVEEGDTAWHAGRVDSPSWRLIKSGVNPNLYTIGIEHEGHTGDVWTDELLDTSSSVIAEVATRWGIRVDGDHVVPHASIYSPKSFCPGTGVELGNLIAVARGKVGTRPPSNFVDMAATVTTRTAVNVRKGVSNTHGDVVRVVPANTNLDVVGWTSAGESVHGNSHWYGDADGNFLWAGATDQPVPTA